MLTEVQEVRFFAFDQVVQQVGRRGESMAVLLLLLLLLESLP